MALVPSVLSHPVKQAESLSPLKRNRQQQLKVYGISLSDSDEGPDFRPQGPIWSEIFQHTLQTPPWW